MLDPDNPPKPTSIVEEIAARRDRVPPPPRWRCIDRTCGWEGVVEARTLMDWRATGIACPHCGLEIVAVPKSADSRPLEPPSIRQLAIAALWSPYERGTVRTEAIAGLDFAFELIEYGSLPEATRRASLEAERPWYDRKCPPGFLCIHEVKCPGAAG
jgi:hypothetical protein